MMTTAQAHAATDDMAAAGPATKAIHERTKARAKLEAYIALCCTGATKFDHTARCVREFQDACNVVAFQQGGLRVGVSA